jgi:hypothetical protein
MADKPKKSIFKRWWFWAIIVVLVIFIAAGSGGNDSQPQKVTPTATQPSAAPTANDQADNKEQQEMPTVFKVGETAELKGVKATVTGIEKPEGDEFNKPEEGKEFVIVNMTIENASNEEINVSSMLGFHAYVDDTAVNEDLWAQTVKEGSNTMDGTVAPGKKLNGSLGYQLPKGWKVLEIEFQPDAFSDDKIVWQLENK